MYPIVIFIVIAASSGTPTGSRRRSTLNHRPGIVYRDPLIATASFPLVGEKDYSSRCPERHLMALHKFRELSVAKCNDGSPAGYYLLRQPKSTRWVIHLQSGWYCADRTSCDLRERHHPTFVSSRLWDSCMMGRGILSTRASSNAYWFEANMVYIPYCSSDLWSGRTTNQRLGNKTFHFMGSAIIEQVVRALLGRHGLRKASHVLLTGSSAGGTGVFLNLDRVQSLLRAAGSDVQVRGVADSGWYLLRPDIQRDASCSDAYVCGAVSLITKAVAAWRPTLPTKCLAAQDSGEKWKCFFGHVIYPHIQGPIFVTQWKFDTIQLSLDNVNLLGYRSNLTNIFNYLKKLSYDFQASLRNVDAVFAPSCVGHTVLETSGWSSIRILDISLPDAIKCWETNLDSARNKRSLRKQSTLVEENVILARGSEGDNLHALEAFDEEEDYPIAYDLYDYLSDMPAPACSYKVIDNCCTPQCNPTCPEFYDPRIGISLPTENELWSYLGLNRLDFKRNGFETLQEFLQAFCAD